MGETKKEELDNKDKARKKRGTIKYLIFVVLIIVATTISYINVDWSKVGPALGNIQGHWPWLLAAVGVVLLSYFIDALIWKVFMRLYVIEYPIRKGIAVSMVGTFYSSISPGSRGGSTMQLKCLNKQGSEVSNALSIIVMSYIIYNISLISFNIVAVSIKGDLIATVGNLKLWGIETNIPFLPLIIIGFIVDLFFILFLLLLSYWHGFHNFIMHKGIGFLAKIKLVKHPDKMRSNLRIRVENFKVELKRLFTNIPVFVLVILLFSSILICRYSVPFFIGASMDAFDPTKAGLNGETFWNVCFISSYHQMVTSIIPIPGGAGTSEFFFESLFQNYLKTDYISATQIMWRSLTYYLMIPIAGMVALLYKNGAREEALKVDRNTMINIQLETYSVRKQSQEFASKTVQLLREQRATKFKKTISSKTKTIKENDLKDKNKVDVSTKIEPKTVSNGTTNFMDYFDTNDEDYYNELINDIEKKPTSNLNKRKKNRF